MYHVYNYMNSLSNAVQFMWGSLRLAPINIRYMLTSILIMGVDTGGALGAEAPPQIFRLYNIYNIHAWKQIIEF